MILHLLVYPLARPNRLSHCLWRRERTRKMHFCPPEHPRLVNRGEMMNVVSATWKKSHLMNVVGATKNKSRRMHGLVVVKRKVESWVENTARLILSVAE